MLNFSEIFEFSKKKFRKIPILKEFEWFEWFGPSPIEPFNSVADAAAPRSTPRFRSTWGKQLNIRKIWQILFLQIFR